MALNPDIRDQAYQFFIEEAPELLQSLEVELLTLSQDHSTTRIHSLMRTAHSIKGGAASVGLEAIATLSHRLENIFKALYSEALEIDTDLESQLLQAYDCLRLPLNQQIETGQFDIEQAMSVAEPIFDQIESCLGDALAETENYIASSGDLGIDMVSSILEVDVVQGLERLATIIDNPDNYEISGELRAQAEVFAGFAELLNLPAFGEIAEVIQRAVDIHPNQVLEIAELALEDFERVRQQVLAAKHQDPNFDFSQADMAPSPALVALADIEQVAQPEADLYSPTTIATDVTDTLKDGLEAELGQEAQPRVNFYPPPDAVNSPAPRPNAAADELEKAHPSAPTPSSTSDLVTDFTEVFESLLGGDLEEAEQLATDPSPDDTADFTEAFENAIKDELESESELEASLSQLANVFGSDLDLSAFEDDELESDEPNPDELDPKKPATDITHQATSVAAIDPIESPITEAYLTDTESEFEHHPRATSDLLSAEVIDVIDETYIHPKADGEDYVITFSGEDSASGKLESNTVPTPTDEPDLESIIHIQTEYSSPHKPPQDEPSSNEPASIEDIIHSVEHIFDDLPSLENADNSDVQSTAVDILKTVPQSSASNLVPLEPQDHALSEASSSEQATISARRRPAKSPRQSPSSPASNLTIRVEADRLERMGNLVGELAINRDGISLQNDQLQGTLKELLGRFSRFQERISQLRNLSDQMLVAPERFRQSQLSQTDGKQEFNAQPHAESLSSLALSSAPAKISDPWSTKFDSLEMDSYGDLHLQLQEIFEDVVQLEEMVGDVNLFARQSDQKLGQQRQMLIQLRDDLTWARMVPLSEILNRFPRMLRDLSVTYQKPVNLKLMGSGILVEKAILEKLYDPLLHLLRNAFDHGIEPSNMRIRSGKPEEGQIEVRAYHRGNQTVIEIADDGQGLNLNRIRDRAIERGWFTLEQVTSMPPEQLYELIFEPGFSTAQQVSELSGRGVGLDVVRAQLSDIRGRVIVDSTPGQGTLFTLRLPLTLTITKLITFLSGSVALAMSADSVEEILTPQAKQIRQLGQQRFLQWQGNIIPVYPIAELLSYGCPLPETPPNHLLANVPPSPPEWGSPILILRRDRQLFAIEVDRIITEQELVVKPFGSAIAPPPYTYGCTILGDGSLVPVIDGTALLDFKLDGVKSPTDMGRKLEPDFASTGSGTPVVKPVQAPTILVVDDSATLRRTLALSLERVGFRILQARDGQEAIDQLQQSTSVQLVICDIEMPNMNGFEFLSQRRQYPQMASIPVVMLTSRSSEKHRWLAMQLGAAAYFTKPFLEQDFIGTLEDLIQ